MKAYLANLSAPVRGVLWMIAAAALFSVMAAIIRVMVTELHSFQVVFLRNLFGVVAMLPWLLRHGSAAIRTARLGAYSARAAIGIANMLCWFSAIALLPLATATALGFTAPLFATLGAALFLGEVVRLRRWTATMVGFAGVLVVLRPGLDDLSLGAGLALVAAALTAMSTLMVKTLSRTESPAAVATWMVLLLTPLSLPTALWVWQWPSLEAWGLALLLGIVGSVGHVCLNRSLAAADASVVVPFDYTKLPLVALWGYLLFAETPDMWTWVGAGIIAASAIYIARREALVARRKMATEAALSPVDPRR
ncbi:MAG: DMT family transporter [Thalassobaculales bacterium]